MIRARCCSLILRAAGWKLVGQVPRTGVLIGAPHTSNWDFFLMILVMWSGGVSPKFLIKKSWMRGPVGWVMARLGGIAVDRDNPVGLVRTVVRMLRSGQPCALVIAPEGMRRKSDHWKSGFYRIAKATRMPLGLGFIDGPTRTTGFGPTLTLTGDVATDMAHLRAFYADKHGLRPEWRTEPRLREEIPATS